MTPYYQSPDGAITLYHADCLDVFPNLKGLSSIVSDLPAGVSFMGRKFWDGDKGGRSQWIAYWAERIAAARAACVPDHISFFWSLPRTQHWSGCAVEDAGYRIVDTLTTINGQGWPKTPGSLRPCKEEWIIARSGAGLMDREACRVERGNGEGGTRCSHFPGPCTGHDNQVYSMSIHVPSKGSGSLPCNIALGHCGGDGGLQCRAVGVRKVHGSDARKADGSRAASNGVTYVLGADKPSAPTYAQDGTESLPAYECRVACRSCRNEWLALSGGEAPRCECGTWAEWACPVAECDAQTGTLKSSGGAITTEMAGLGYGGGNGSARTPIADEGGSSRFFNRLDSLDASLAYFAKCPSGERHMGCDELYWKVAKKDPFGFVQVTREEWERLSGSELVGTSSGQDNREGRQQKGQRARGNSHPTTKRISAMRHIHRLAGSTRPDWHVGDPCVGSGTGALAAILDGVRYTGTEICEQALVIAVARIKFLYGLSHEAFRALRDEEAIPVANQPAPTGQSAFQW